MPSSIGDIYTEVALHYLTCLDPDSGVSTMQDDDGVPGCHPYSIFVGVERGSGVRCDRSPLPYITTCQPLFACFGPREEARGSARHEPSPNSAEFSSGGSRGRQSQQASMQPHPERGDCFRVDHGSTDAPTGRVRQGSVSSSTRSLPFRAPCSQSSLLTRCDQEKNPLERAETKEPETSKHRTAPPRRWTPPPRRRRRRANAGSHSTWPMA